MTVFAVNCAINVNSHYTQDVALLDEDFPTFLPSSCENTSKLLPSKNLCKCHHILFRFLQRLLIFTNEIRLITHFAQSVLSFFGEGKLLVWTSL